jgi:hypothetical protein
MYPKNKQAVHNYLVFKMNLLPKHNRYKFVCNSLMQCPMKTRITTYYSDNFTFQCRWCIPWPFSIFNRRHVTSILFFILHRRVTLLFYFAFIVDHKGRLGTVLLAFDFFTSKFESMTVCCTILPLIGLWQKLALVASQFCFVFEDFIATKGPVSSCVF